MSNLDHVVTIVSGLPRSGTSMMMKMMDAAELPILTDNLRTADADNPKGYYEFEPVKKMREDVSWMPEAVGKVVKIISFLLTTLPPEFQYKVVFVRRAIPEVLSSQQKMMDRRGETNKVDDGKMTDLYEKHLTQIKKWLAEQKNIDVLYVDHQDAMANPVAVAKRVNAFLGGHLDEAKMAGVVDNSLYRNRVEDAPSLM